MDNLIDPNLANSFKNKSPERKAILLTDYMVKNGITYYDESVTQLEHALQAGNLARNAGADAFLTSAALLHDIGHFLLDEHDAQQIFLEEDLNHEVVGANYLSPFLPEKVIIPIRFHVPAKRYLCTTDNSYHETLSDASKKSFQLQGGKMSSDEIKKFERIPDFETALQVRRWDDLAKDTGLASNNISDFIGDLTLVFEAAINM